MNNSLNLLASYHDKANKTSDKVNHHFYYPDTFLSPTKKKFLQDKRNQDDTNERLTSSYDFFHSMSCLIREFTN